MRRATLTFGFAVALAGFATGAAAEWTAHVATEHFRWAESTSPSVTESGQRVGLGIGWTQDRAAGWLLAYRGEIYGGTVHYKGATLLSGTPVESNTDYYGMKNEVQGIYRFSGGRAQLVAGLGLDYWERWLSDVQSETYYIYYLRLGGEYGGRATQGWFIGGGLKYPLYTEQNAHFDDIGFDQNPLLHPGRLTSAYAEVGYRFGRRWSTEAYYEGWRFGQSRPVTVTTGGGTTTFQAFQPKSNADSVGLRLHYHF